MKKNSFCGALIIILTVFITISILSLNVHADVLGPGWFSPQGTLVSPGDAKKFYDKLTSSKQTKSTKLQTSQSMATNGMTLTGDPAIATPEITELARALKNDPILIYEYVRNHVDYVPYFGSLKGATLTYLDGSGNDFDQASLMIALLRASGFTASYVYGQLSIPISGAASQKDMQHWLCAFGSTEVIGKILADGGIPATLSSPDYVVDRVWVQATISGSTYVFDPAFKPYLKTSGINLKTAMGYDHNSLLSAAGGTTGANYIENLNETGLRTKMDEYTLNLSNYIRNNYPNAHMEEIIGGRTIVTEHLPQLPTQLGFPILSSTVWTSIPDAYAHKVRIQHGQIDTEVNIADLAGKRLSITYASGSGTMAVRTAASTSVNSTSQKQVSSTKTSIEPAGKMTQQLTEQQMTASSPSNKGTVSPMALLGSLSFPTIYPPDFGLSYVDRSYTVVNNTQYWYNYSATLENNTSGAFSLTNGTNGTENFYLLSYSSHPVYIRFSNTGQTPGVKTAKLTIRKYTTDDQHILLSTDYVNLSGRVGNPPSLNGSYGYDFGTDFLNNPLNGTCRFMNSGTLNLSITAVNITGTDAARFQIVSGGGTGSLAAGQYRDIGVQYLADALGTHSANLHVQFNYDGLQYNFNMPLSGTTNSSPAPAATLWLDDTVLAQETAPVAGPNLDILTISVNHPYADQNGTYCDQSVPYTLKRGNTYAIVYDFGGSRMGRLLEKRQRQLQTYRESGLSDTTREVLTESLNVMGMNWMRDTALNDKLLAQISESIITSHHRFGVVAQETGYYIDIKEDVSTINSMNGIDADRWACFKSLIFMHSALEHGVLEELQINRPAASTVKLLQTNNSQGGRVYEANASNFSSIQPLLTGYTTQDIANIQGAISNGYTIYLPNNGLISVISGTGNWSGCGYIAQKFWIENNISRGSVGMVIGGGYHGGYSILQGAVDIATLGVKSTLSLLWDVVDLKWLSFDPVDMYSGAWVHSSTDLSLNGGMGGLGFKRSYYSQNNNIKNMLGYGWSHNYNIYAEVHSSPELGYGTRQPQDAVAMTAASTAILDIMNGTPDLKSWMTGSLIAKWGMDKLNDNAVSVHLENDVLTYVKLPDGSYATPPGVTSKLVWDSDHYRLDERFSRTVLFNTANHVSRITDADGNQVNFTYSSGVLTGVADGFSHSLTFNYTGNLLTSVSDSAGRNVIYGYDTANNLVSYTDPENKVWNCGYDGSHRILTLRNPLNITTVTNEYDSFGRVKTQIVPRQTGTATYNLYFSGYRNIEEDPSGNQTVYNYDEHKRLIATEDALGNSKVMIHDGQNHVIVQTDQRGYPTSYQYDRDNNLVMVTDPLQNSWIRTFDSQFRLTDTFDPLWNRVHYDYDSEHHPIRTKTYPSSGVTVQTSRTYYTNGLLNTSTDGKNVTTTYTYDTHGNPDTSYTGSHPVINYDFDAAGRMTALTDQVGSQTSFSFDKRNLLLSRTDPLLKVSSNTYYDDGTVHTATDRKGRTTTFTYTPTGKPNTVAYQGGTTISYTYDVLDNLRQVQDNSGIITNFDYDQVNRIESMIDGNNFSTGYGYDGAGNLTTLTYPGNRTVTYTYDELNRLRTLSIDWLSKTATYSYDTAGRMRQLTQFNGTIAKYTYDNANRLTALENRAAGSGTVITTHSFTLDGNGNRGNAVQLGSLPLGIGASSIDYGYNTRKNRLTSAGSTTFGYDDEGQLSTSGPTSYTFDDAHRLTAIGSVNQFTYDAPGNRIAVARNGTTTKYAYDASGNLIAEADANNVIQRYYIYGSGGLLAMVTASGQLYCYHFDATGHTVALTDSTKATVNKYVYTPFGTISSNSIEQVSQPFKYVGQFGVMSEPGGFYYMRARYYDPNVGRFISEDPKGFNGGDVNLFAYVGNNPVMGIDPLGLELRIYNRPVAGGRLSWIDANHAFLYSTETRTWLGTAGSSGYGGQADERNVIDNGGAYNVVPNPNNVSEIDVMNYMDQTKNSGVYIPGVRDCHSAVDRTLSHFNLENPGAPGSRLGAIPNCGGNACNEQTKGINSTYK